MAKGLLFMAFDFSTAHEDEFHDWYDLEHVPERCAFPGSSTRNAGSTREPKIQSRPTTRQHRRAGDPAYRAVGGDNQSVWTKRVSRMCRRIMRYEGEQLVPGDLTAAADAGALLVASMNIDPADGADFTAWYNSEHLPQLAAVPGVLSARRFRATDTEIGTAIPGAVSPARRQRVTLRCLGTRGQHGVDRTDAAAPPRYADPADEPVSAEGLTASLAGTGALYVAAFQIGGPDFRACQQLRARSRHGD